MKQQPTGIKIEAGQTLTARSFCDYDCIYEVPVIARKGNWVTVLVHGKEKRKKVDIDWNGDGMRACIREVFDEPGLSTGETKLNNKERRQHGPRTYRPQREARLLRVH